jgi:hypothetical protein
MNIFANTRTVSQLRAQCKACGVKADLVTIRGTQRIARHHKPALPGVPHFAKEVCPCLEWDDSTITDEPKVIA